MKIISEFELNDKIVVVRKHDENDPNSYDITFDNEVKQPKQDAEGIIRALSHYLHNTNYILQKERLTK